MISFPLGRASAIAAVGFLLAGCGGSSQSQATIPLASSSVRQAAQHGRPRKSELIYAAGDGHTYVITYPQGRLVGTIDEGGFDACSDSSGNVYLAVDAPRVDEFVHGATTPSV
ncbi:MAG TPA: hypothetical protein VHS56_12705, partial [Candidatus Cybelea sp.]|nr:hypothetical protein [Candidatus Cybelea sp.]